MTKAISKGARAAKGADKVADAGKRTSAAGQKEGWDLHEGGGYINERKYSHHALERMAPDTPEVRASLSGRARKKAEELGYKPQTREYKRFFNKYVDPRDVPPSVVEDTIKNGKKKLGNRPGTFSYESTDVQVIVNELGDVITVIPK